MFLYLILFRVNSIDGIDCNKATKRKLKFVCNLCEACLNSECDLQAVCNGLKQSAMCCQGIIGDAGLGMADMGKLETHDSGECHLTRLHNSTDFDFSQITCSELNSHNQTSNFASIGFQLGVALGLLSLILAIMLWVKRKRVSNDTEQGLL